MASLAGWIWRMALGGAALGLVLAGSLPTAKAYSDAETRRIFDILDTNHDGKVSKLEFEANKVDVFFFRGRKNPDDTQLRYEETGLSREFFDKADQGHKGYLTGLDMIDAIRFEDIDTKHRGYFTFEDLNAGLKSISR